MKAKAEQALLWRRWSKYASVLVACDRYALGGPSWGYAGECCRFLRVSARETLTADGKVQTAMEMPCYAELVLQWYRYVSILLKPIYLQAVHLSHALLSSCNK